jgi:GH35 family endo-1,4-beta-xylanase
MKIKTGFLLFATLLTFGAWAAAAGIEDGRSTASSYAGREPDAPWRRAAAERIEKIRKGDLSVAVKDADGRPVSDATVTVRMRRHAFDFGSAVAARALFAETADNEKYRETIKRMFNMVVLENDLKWPDWERNREQSIRAVDWLRENGIRVRGHCLVWPAWNRMPRDVGGLKDDAAALRERVRKHIADETSALRGKIAEWDVINEPYTNHAVMDVLGNEVMGEWFKTAREGDPDVRLFLNDYSILSNGGTDAAHQAHYEKTIRSLLESGAPLDGIGMQGHFGRRLTAPERMLDILDRFGKFGKPIKATEFDVDATDEPLQADFTRDFMTALFSHPSVNGIVMWGFWEGRHWKPNAALFRRDWSIKPNGRVWMDLVFKQWWTEVEGRTDAQGNYRTRGFLGDYEIEAARDGKAVRENVALDGDGTTATVTLK